MIKILTLFFIPVIFAENRPKNRIEELLKIKKITDYNIKTLEEEYQTLIQPLTLANLIMLYDPANQKEVQITYSSFTPEAKEGSTNKLNEDLGVGLHVVRKWRDIEVNEQWPENKETHNLYYPDAIRIKVKQAGQVYFDMIKVAWNKDKKPAIYRRSQYVLDEKTKYNKQIQSKVPVSAPYSCIRCHQGANFHNLTRIGPSFYKKPLEETPGFKNYLEYLQTENTEKTFIEKVKTKLLKPHETFQLSTLKDALQNTLDKKIYNWLAQDSSLQGLKFEWKEQGVYYNKRKEPFLDALETVHSEKYKTWLPAEVF